MAQPLTLSSLLKLNDTSIKDVTSIGSVSVGEMVLISSATASASASIEFSLGSYKEYKFFFVNMHPATNNVTFEFQCSTDNGSNYNTTLTSTAYRTYHNEAGTATTLSYDTSYDKAQGTSFQNLNASLGSDNDQSVSGFLTLFNPSSTSYVKHFISNTNTSHQLNYTMQIFIGGYFNTTSALTNIKFQMSSGNIDDGKILMFGIN